MARRFGRKRAARRTGFSLFLGGVGAGLGAGAMYLFDPFSGKRRRGDAQQQTLRALRDLKGGVRAGVRDAWHRMKGAGVETVHRLRQGSVPDDQLTLRVRAKLGRVCSHPGSVATHCRDGVVTLSGPVLAREVEQVRRGLASVPGVHRLVDRLEVHRSAEHVPGLQGQGHVLGRRRDDWRPSTRLGVALLGGAVLSGGLASRSRWGLLAGGVGAVGLTRSLTNLPFRRLFGTGGGRRAIDIRKSVRINAPVEEVYAYWCQFEQFPRFMTHVKEVRRTGRDRLHWKVEGPAGLTVAWDAEISLEVPREVLAWRSIPGSQVENAGIIRFVKEAPERTRLDLRLSYNPPAGASGHALAKFFRNDPKRQLDDDLLRFKTLLEQGKATGRETVTRQELRPQGSPRAAGR